MKRVSRLKLSYDLDSRESFDFELKNGARTEAEMIRLASILLQTADFLLNDVITRNQKEAKVEKIFDA